MTDPSTVALSWNAAVDMSLRMMHNSQIMISDDEALAWLLQRAPGPVETSVRKLAKQWGWNPSAVDKRLKQWAADGHIERSIGSSGCTVITVTKTSVSTVEDTVSYSVAQPVSEPQTPVPWPRQPRFIVRALGSFALISLAAAIAWFGIQINAWYWSTLGRTPEASRWFAGLSISVELLAFILPTIGGTLWLYRQRAAALVAWGLFPPTLLVTILATVGFASLNIADTTADRSKTTTQRALLLDSISELQSKLSAVVTDIHEGRKPLQSARQRDSIDLQLQAAEKEFNSLPAVTVSDPQADAASALAKWATFGIVNLSPEDIRLARIASMMTTQIAGLVLWLGVALWQSRYTKIGMQA